MQMWGQTYDDASVLQGRMTRMARRIKNKNPKALSVHCVNHSLNLILQEVTSQCPVVREALSLEHNIHEMMSSSPVRLDIFETTWRSLSESATSCYLKPLYRTRWTCRTPAVTSTLDNHYILDKIISAEGNTEAGKKATGVTALMTQFEVHLGLKICLHLFSATEEVAQVL